MRTCARAEVFCYFVGFESVSIMILPKDIKHDGIEILRQMKQLFLEQMEISKGLKTKKVSWSF